MKRAPEAAPMSTRALLLTVLAAAAVSVFLWDTVFIYPFRLLVTLMHESGHAIAAKLVGGEVLSVTISPGEGGLTLSRFEPSLLKRMFVSSSGYLGSSIAGAALLVGAGRMRSGRVMLWGLVIWMLVVAVVWVPFVPPGMEGGAAKASGFARTDGLFTLAFVAAVAAALGFIASKAPVPLRRVTVVWIATLSCLAALQDVKGLFGYGLAGSGSDADSMAQLTGLPAGLWAAAWMLLSLGAIFIGLRSIVKRRRVVRARSGFAVA